MKKSNSIVSVRGDEFSDITVLVFGLSGHAKAFGQETVKI